MLLIVLVILIVLAFGGGLYSPAYRTGGFGLGGLLIIILILFLMFGGGHGRVF